MSFTDESVDSLDDLGHNGVAESPTFTVTALLTSLGERNQDAEYLVTKGNDLVVLLQQYPYIKEDLVFSAFGHRLQTLLTHPKKEVVAIGYRICRYVIYDASSIQALISLKLDTLIVISLSKDATHNIEREQALKLVRKFLDTPGGPSEITRGIANAVLAIAELRDHPTELQEDRLRKVCIETTAELCLHRPDLVPPYTLVQYIIDGPYELSSLCATVMLTLLNEPQGRKYISKSDILRIISPFTEFPVKGHLNNEKLQTNAYIITRFMKSLAGFHGLCLGDKEPLKDLIHCLSFPVQGVVSKLLDIFLDVLMINPLSKKPPAGHANKMVLVPIKLENEFILHTHFLALLVTTLLEAGLPAELMGIMNRDSDEANRTKAGFLLTEICNLAYNLVPDELLVSLQDKLVYLVNPKPSMTDTHSEFAIEKLTRKSNKGRTMFGLDQLKINDNFLDYSKKTTTKAVYNVDEPTLKQMLNDTKVLSTKSFSKWDCEIISQLFAGPFSSGRRLEEVNRTTKFMKRLLSFYRPFKHKFSGTKKTKHSQRFIKLGCDIMSCLLSSTEGLRILKESKIVPQIAECLAQLDPYSGLYAKDQIFSQDRLEGTLTNGYFDMLGILSTKEHGLELLQQWKVFSIIHHIADNPFKREDLLILFMKSMDYKKSGQLRILLSKFLHSANRNIKLEATKLLSSLLHEPDCNTFICEALIEQLYEQDDIISRETIKILTEYCNASNSNLDQIVELSPSIHLLRRCGEQGECLLMKFLSTSAGFGYLQSQGFIDEEFANWISGERYITYALDIELLLMGFDPDLRNSDRPLKRSTLPSHFFGELVKTEEGFNVIVHSGILTELVNIIRYHATSLERPEEAEQMDYLKLSACMWAIGMISTSELGIETLDVNGCIEDLVHIATSSPLINLRGSAFYVLGLISKTNQGIEILDELGWSTKMNVFNQSIGMTLPRDLTSFIGWESGNRDVFDKEVMEYSILDDVDTSDETLKRLIKVIGTLCNPIFEKSLKDLVNLEKQHKEYFEDPDVFFIVMKFFDMYRYTPKVRKAIIETFTSNRRMLDIIVKRDKRRMKELIG